MVAFPRISRLTADDALLASAAAALLVVILSMLAPIGWIERLSVASGLADHLRAAEPPLGITARAVLAMLAAGVVAALVWAGLRLLMKRRPSEPQLRRHRADWHPDAPARRPVLAREDLGTPLFEVDIGQRIARGGQTEAEVREDAEFFEQPLPADLDTPLVGFDRVPVRRTEETLDDMRITTFELTPMVRPTGAGGTPSLSTLLDRLERGVARREGPPSPPAQRSDSIEATLATLRRLATQVG